MPDLQLQTLAGGKDNRQTLLWGSQAYAELRPAPCLAVQGGSLRAHMPDLETDSGTLPPPSGTDSADLDADIAEEEMKQAKAILAGCSFFMKS